MSMYPIIWITCDTRVPPSLPTVFGTFPLLPQHKLNLHCLVTRIGTGFARDVCCRRSLPRDALHFSVSRGARKFWTCEPGHEWLNNSNSLPCLTCATLNRASIKRGVSHVKETCTVEEMFPGNKHDFRCAMTGFDFGVSEQVGVPIIAIITTSSSPILA